MPPVAQEVQRSLDDAGRALCDVTFVVIDLETTGGSPASCAITEVGAVKYRGGERLGTLQTLVNPGLPIPPEITYLTGITEAMVVPAPRIDAILGPLVRFIGDAVIVGHNIRFDLGFLGAAMDRHGYPRFTNVVVDTCALARRLVRDEVPNCKLHTLARHFRTQRTPTHRALDDAWATAEVLHALLERAGSLGVLGLDDLVALPKISGHPQLAKLKLVRAMPRAPGVYLFRDGSGRVLYVGKAVDLRRRVRSYFSSDNRRKVDRLLREMSSIDWIVCSGDLEASVLEVRMIHRHAPRYNQRTKHWQRYAYLKLTLDEKFPRLSVVKAPKDGDRCLYLGPLPSAAGARLVAEAIQTAVPLRRCTGRPPRVPRDGACVPAQLGVATCPCSGAIGQNDYAAIVDDVVRGLTDEPARLLDPLAARMAALAHAGRYEEAADVRDRAAALARALSRQRRFDSLRRAGRVEVVVDGDVTAIVEDGLLAGAWRAGAPRAGAPRAGAAASAGEDDGMLPWDASPATVPATTTAAVGDAATVGAAVAATPAGAPTGALRRPLPRHLADEVNTISTWIETHAARLRVVACDVGWAWPLPRLPTFEPATGGSSVRHV